MKPADRIELLKEFIGLAKQEIKELDEQMKQEITDLISTEREKRQDELNNLLFKQEKCICWFCGSDIIKDEDYKHEDKYFCNDKCINYYNQAEQEKADKNITKICKEKLK